MTENRKFLIYPWDVSTTNAWTLEGLHGLRDEDPKKIAELLRGEGMEQVYFAAMAEYFAHGNLRKAAEVTRVLAETEPSITEYVKTRFDKRLVDSLLTTQLENIPSKPSEYPTMFGVPIEFVH